jgi:glycosyltransferase involved in cell wall biosynthesis
MSDTRFSVICLSSQDWQIDLPTNRQQIMRRAAAQGHEVLFVETGEFVGKHLLHLLRRGPRRSLVARLTGGEAAAPGVTTVKALNVLPWGHTYAFANRVDRWVTARRIRTIARRLPQPVVLWIYDPCASVPASEFGAAFSVYDCVDDYAEQVNGAPNRQALVRRADTETAKNARVVFTTSRALFERHGGDDSGSTHLVPNVGDYRLFSPAADRAYAASELNELPRPVYGFAGNFLASKVDFDLLESLARAEPDATILLIGPERQESSEELERIRRLPNVRWLGKKPYAELPRYVAAFDVALIPYLENEYTRSCFPLKVYESLAAGKPVVAAGLPDLAGMGPDVTLARDAEEFVAAARAAALAQSPDDVERRMRLAAQNTWESRTERLLTLVESAFDAA